MNQDKLYNTVQRLKPEKLGKTVKLGDTLRELMEHQISPRQARLGPIFELWSQLLPTELARHCKLSDVSGGQLKVLVDSPAHLYELKLCSSELLEELQRQCPRAKIKGIKFVVGE